jgi:hypothetical protein
MIATARAGVVVRVAFVRNVFDQRQRKRWVQERIVMKTRWIGEWDSYQLIGIEK